MKRLIAGVVLFGAVLLLCGFGVWFSLNNYEKITEDLNLGEEFAKQGEFDKAKECFLRAEEMYISKEQYMAAFVNHETLDEIGKALSAVAPLAEKDSENEMMAALYEAKTALTHLRNDHKFLIGNLF